MKTEFSALAFPGFSFFFLGFVSLAALGCQPQTAAESPEPGPALKSVTTPTMVVTDKEALSTIDLLDRADEHLREERYEKAVSDYRLVVENSLQSITRREALLGWGTALDLGGQPRQALVVYSRYVSEAPESPSRDKIAVRVVRLLVYLERYDEARARALILDLGSLAELEQIAIYGALALGALESGSLSEAESNISRARNLVDAGGFDRVGTPPLDVAALYFALGEVRRQRAAAIDFDPLPSDFATALEQRCQLILDAQSAYSESMRSQDAHFSSMSGVRVGELYHSLHQDIVSIPSPAQAASQESQQLFEGAMRLRYSILLRKSLSMMQATVDLLERSEGQTRWREQAQGFLEEIRLARDQEESAIDALPYTRAQLQQVLDEMAQRSQQP